MVFVISFTLCDIAFYPQWENITLISSEKRPAEVLYLYINGRLIDKFTDSITFKMWGAPITVLITPEILK